ncbi:hypothetical protein BMS3Abin16_00704 [archaeon BMS3Abin16]|nr:hypothetical protein BMS3Abin16_00704 [archaeon BMS3Abin16]
MELEIKIRELHTKGFSVEEIAMKLNISLAEVKQALIG